MRKAFQKNAPASATERFAAALGTDAYQKKLSVFFFSTERCSNSVRGKRNSNCKKGNIFFACERIRAVLLRDRSALMIESGRIIAAGIEDVQKFIRAPEPAAAPVAAAVVEPESEPLPRSSTPKNFSFIKELSMISISVHLPIISKREGASCCAMPPATNILPKRLCRKRQSRFQA